MSLLESNTNISFTLFTILICSCFVCTCSNLLNKHKEKNHIFFYAHADHLKRETILRYLTETR